MPTLEIECDVCKGTGIFRGKFDPPEVVIVCRECRGAAKKTLTYTPFTRIKLLAGVETVLADWPGPGETAPKVSYADFRKGILPK